MELKPAFTMRAMLRPPVDYGPGPFGHRRFFEDLGDQYFRSTPRFEVGDERYAWLTQSVWVGEGRIVEGFGVEYRIHEVT